jgi:signal transduction histidine kinase
MDSFPDSLAQVVVDLLENADRHAFEGTENGLLRISAVASHTQVEIRLTDNGPGMSVDVAARVFEPFFTTKMGQGGPGLGLSIARNQVGGLLGGRISVESTHGAGTCVVLTLPLAPAAHPPQAHPATTLTPHTAWRSDHEPDTQP